MENQYVTKPYRQRSTTVTSVPVQVRNRLRLTKGDYLCWQVDMNSDFVQISKVVPGGKSNGRDTGNSDSEDQGGRA